MDVTMAARAALILAFCTFCLRTVDLAAQTSAAGARDAALAGTSAAAPISASAPPDLWSEANPAGWSQLDGFTAGIHAARLYGLDELRLGAVQAAIALRTSSVVLGVRTFGYSGYRETILTTGIARAIRWGTHRPLYTGIRVRYHQTAIPGYGSASSYGLSTGLLLPVAPGLAVGLSAENAFVLGGSLSGELPRRLHAGLSISTSGVVVLAAASKEPRTPLTSRLGIEISPVDGLALRAGYSLAPPRVASGVGLRVDPLTIDVAAERHVILGWTPSCSVAVRW